MYVDLSCNKCGDCSRVPFAKLYEVWSEGYKTMSEEHKPRAKAVTNIKCHCGNNTRYDGPIFQYIFQLIFDEFVKEEEA